MKYILLKENIQKARKILKEYDKDESDEKFQSLKGMLGNNQGYLGMFTNLLYSKRYKLEQLKNLKKVLLRNKKLLKYLPQEVVNYDDIEKLEDDLTNAKEWALYNRNFVSRLTGHLKVESRKDEELKNIYTHSSSDVKKMLFNTIIKKVSRYNNFDDFKSDVISMVSNSNSDIEKKIKEIENTKGSYIVYNENKIIIAEIFSKEASCKVGSKSWCISGDTGEYWDQYAGISTGNKQYFIWNFRVPITDNERQVGVTIKQSGSVHTAHQMDDSSINTTSFMDRFNIPMEVLSPMDYSKDIDKIIDSIGGVNSNIMRILDEHSLLEKYASKIPNYWKFIYGMMDESELGNIPIFKKCIYAKGHHSEINALFEFCNMSKDFDGDFDEFMDHHKSSSIYNQLLDLDFRDKCIMLKKYQDGYSETSISNYGIEILFYKETNELKDIYPIDLEVDKDGDIKLTLKMDEDEYTESILNMDSDAYLSMQNLDSHYNTIFDDVSDEQDQLINYFTDEVKDKFIEFLIFIKKFNSHVDFINDIDKFIEQISENNLDDFHKISSTVRTVDRNFKFNGDKNSILDEYWDKIEESAMDFSQEDATEYNKILKGEFDSEKGWIIEMDDITETLKNSYSGDEDVITISDWINSHPLDMDQASFHFSDYVSSWVYLNLASTEDANKYMLDTLEDVMENDHESFDVIEKLKFIKITNYLNHHYKPISQEPNRYMNDKWYGYISKHKNGSKYSVVPLDQINDDVMYVYYLDKPIDEYEFKHTYYNGNKGYSKLKENNSGELSELGINIKKVDLSEVISGEVSIDPNQLEIKFEKIMSFKSFLYTKQR